MNSVKSCLEKANDSSTVAASVTRLIVTYKIEEATLTGDMDITCQCNLHQ